MKTLFFPWKKSDKPPQRHRCQIQLSCGHLGTTLPCCHWWGLVPCVGDITITPSWDGSPKPPGMPGWDRGVTVISLDLHRTALAGLRHEGQGERERGVIYTQGAREQQCLIRDLCQVEPSAPRDTHTAWPTVSAPILSKITPFGAGLKGKCVRLDLPGLVPALVAWAGGEKSNTIQVPAAEASLFYVQMLNWHKHSFFFKAQRWFVEFNDFLRYLFSYLFPLSIGSRLFNIFNGIFLSVFLN